MRLITIPFSHFCEKARWGLDRARLAYTEQGYAPAVHRLALVPRRSSTVPVLVDNGRTIRGSSEILRLCDAEGHAAAPVFPHDPAVRADVEELVARFDRRLGPATRLWLYSWLVEDREQFLRYSALGLAPDQRRRFERALPIIMRVVRKGLGIRAGTREWAANRADEELAFVAERLSDGRPFLAGDSFTAADLTFAALSAAVIMPPGYGGGAISPPPAPPEVARQLEARRETVAGRHAVAMYADWRVAA
jgi:glutathione S-transferase